MELASTNSTHKEAWILIEGRKIVHIYVVRTEEMC